MGTIIGSFLNVVIYRLPRGISVAYPPSFCPHCKKPVKWYDNVPVLGYFFIKGRCRSCGIKISPRYPAVEFLLGLLFVLFFVKFGLVKIYFFYIILMGYLVVLSFIDIDRKIVPDNMVLLLILTGTFFGICNINESVSLFDGIAGAAGTGIIAYGLNFFSNGKFGEGDVKLFAALGLCVGLRGSLTLMLISFMVGGVAGALLLVFKLKKRTDAVPFVPFIAAAFIINAMLS
ncbi:MAG: prepilin peptidase [Spirochaetia bacterium]|nr:prepilin peptidase [Spirochaetia bacterium]